MVPVSRIITPASHYIRNLLKSIYLFNNVWNMGKDSIKLDIFDMEPSEY